MQPAAMTRYFDRIVDTLLENRLKIVIILETKIYLAVYIAHKVFNSR